MDSTHITGKGAALHVVAFPADSNRAKNPYKRLLAAALRRQEVQVDEWSPKAAAQAGVDIVHVHWPESALTMARWVRAVQRSSRFLWSTARARRRGAHVVWTVHNLRSHEQRYPRTEQVFWQLFVRLVDGWLTLSQVTVEAVVALYPRLATRPHAAVPHGHYRDVYPDNLSQPAARARLGLAAEDRVLGFFGRVKAYKGLPELVSAFMQLDMGTARLLIAGRCLDPALGAQLTSAASRDSRIRVHLAEVPNSDVQVWLRAADVVVLPYRAILHSGSALLALSFRRPILVPDMGMMSELRELLGREWVITYSALGPEVLEAALLREEPKTELRLEMFDWDAIAERTLHLYRRVLEGSSR